VVPVECPQCGSSNDLDLIEDLEDGRKHIRCTACGHDWLRGEGRRVFRTVQPPTFEEMRARFPSAGAASAAALLRAAALKSEFLLAHPAGESSEVALRDRYEGLFGKERLASTTPNELKSFVNANLGGKPGNTSVFNTAWNKMGARDAAQRVRQTIDYLLYGPTQSHLEDRLTKLIDGKRELGMAGFRESLLTKVLCMVEPDRFLPIQKYTGVAGKKEIAESVYGLELPTPETVTWTIGRLIVWSNDLLVELLGDGFRDMQHAAEFLWWAKDKTRKEEAALRAS
jgi:Zn ribbon nucleic-acid-binding protein